MLPDAFAEYALPGRAARAGLGALRRARGARPDRPQAPGRLHVDQPHGLRGDRRRGRGGHRRLGSGRASWPSTAPCCRWSPTASSPATLFFLAGFIKERAQTRDLARALGPAASDARVRHASSRSTFFASLGLPGTGAVPGRAADLPRHVRRLARGRRRSPCSGSSSRRRCSCWRCSARSWARRRSALARLPDLARREAVAVAPLVVAVRRARRLPAARARHHRLGQLAAGRLSRAQRRHLRAGQGDGGHDARASSPGSRRSARSHRRRDRRRRARHGRCRATGRGWSARGSPARTWPRPGSPCACGWTAASRP